MTDLKELNARIALVRSDTQFVVEAIEAYCASHVQSRTRAGGPFGRVLQARIHDSGDVLLRRRIADLITEQRSILNALAKVLMARAGHDGPEDYPLHPEPAKYERSATSFLNKITDQDRAKVRVHSGLNNILVQLQLADNARKHHRLTLTAAISRGIGINQGSALNVSVRTIHPAPSIGEEWTDVCHIGGTFSHPPRPTFSLRFDDPPALAGRYADMWLDHVAQCVAGEVALYS